eukprot:SAG25_NODE_1676_length_2570_cov_3.027924_3_plen_59_part_00
MVSTGVRIIAGVGAGLPPASCVSISRHVCSRRPRQQGLEGLTRVALLCGRSLRVCTAV